MPGARGADPHAGEPAALRAGAGAAAAEVRRLRGGELSGTRDRRGERLVRLAVAEDPATAEVWRDALEQAGIRSLVRNVDTLAAWSGGAALTLELLVL